MTNFVHALAVLEAARRPGEIRIHPHDAVEALAKAGLLAPDLPEPDRITDRYLVWEDEEVWIVDDEAAVYTDLGEFINWMSVRRARNLAHILLAAAQHAEEA